MYLVCLNVTRAIFKVKYICITKTEEYNFFWIDYYLNSSFNQQMTIYQFTNAAYNLFNKPQCAKKKENYDNYRYCQLEGKKKTIFIYRG